MGFSRALLKEASGNDLSWSVSPVIDRKDPMVAGKLRSPFHRMIWEFLSLSLWDKATSLSGSGSSSLRPVVVAISACFRWVGVSVNLCSPFFIFCASSTLCLRGLDDPDSRSFPWSLYTCVENLESVYWLAAAAMTSLLTYSSSYCKWSVVGVGRLGAFQVPSRAPVLQGRRGGESSTSVRHPECS